MVLARIRDVGEMMLPSTYYGLGEWALPWMGQVGEMHIKMLRTRTLHIVYLMQLSRCCTTHRCNPVSVRPPWSLHSSGGDPSPIHVHIRRTPLIMEENSS